MRSLIYITRGFLLLSLLTIGIAFQTFAQGTWTAKSGFTANRYRADGFSIGTKGYVGIGNAGNTTSYKDLWEWDQTSNTWTQKADFPGKIRCLSVGFSIGTKGYFGTGTDSTVTGQLQEFWEWDQASNIWTQKADFAGAARLAATGFSIGTKGYIGLGGTEGFFSTLYYDFWEWDQATNTWTQIADYPGKARSLATCFTINSQAYVGTGLTGNAIDTASYMNDFYAWDQTTGRWTAKASFPGKARCEASGFAIGDCGYLGLGTTNVSKGSVQDFWRYNVALNSWVQVADCGSGLREMAVAFSIGNYGYISTGWINDNTASGSADLWEYADPNGCSNVVVPPPVASFEASDSTICTNSCVSFTDLSTNNPTSWHWSFQGGMPATSSYQNPQQICYLDSGNFRVTLVAYNSGGRDTIQLPDFIHVNPSPPTPLITQSNDSLFCKTDPTYTGYQWYADTSLVPGATDTLYIAPKSGNYNVAVTNKFHCSIAVGINVILGVQNLASQNSIFICSNPARNELLVNIYNVHEKTSIIIYNVFGQKLQEENVGSEKHVALDINALAAGVYFVEVNDKTDKWTGKFVKQ